MLSKMAISNYCELLRITIDSLGTGVVHLASTESTGGSTSGEEELSECDMAALSSETKRNTKLNESMGEIAGHGVKAAWRTSRTRRLVTSSL